MVLSIEISDPISTTLWPPSSCSSSSSTYKDGKLPSVSIESVLRTTEPHTTLSFSTHLTCQSSLCQRLSPTCSSCQKCFTEDLALSSLSDSSVDGRKPPLADKATQSQVWLTTFPHHIH